MAYITCRVCGFTAPEEWFPRRGIHRRKDGSTVQYRKAICPMCLQEEKDKRKQQNRAIEKARTLFYRHVEKYGNGLTPMDFAKKFSWDITQIANDIKRNYEGQCPYCNQPYKDMGHGLRDITLDILNPTEPPYYTTNVGYCCNSCNAVKARKQINYILFYRAMAKQRREFLNSEHGTLANPQYKMGLGM